MPERDFRISSPTTCFYILITGRAIFSSKFQAEFSENSPVRTYSSIDDVDCSENLAMLNLLAVVCPPLAVLATGTPGRAATNLALTLLLYVPGVLHARSVVEQTNLERRYNSVMLELERRH
jgi:uncharacterized membrane protein YqaE (UPF0057 family)